MTYLDDEGVLDIFSDYQVTISKQCDTPLKDGANRANIPQHGT